MASGPEHYKEAEALLEEASDPANHGVSSQRTHIALAQVHATLALAAATAMWPAGLPDAVAWKQVTR